MNDTSLQLEVLDIGAAVRQIIELMAMGRWPLEARIHGHCSSMLHRCELRLRADRFARGEQAA